MDYRKLDAGLVTACKAAARSPQLLEVFVQTTQPPTAEQARILQTAGVHDLAPGRKVFTARLALEAVANLSEQSWVKAIICARRLFPARLG